MPQRDLTGPGVSHAYVSRIEADLRTPSVKAIRKLAAKLGVSPDYLERGLDIDVAEERELRVLECELALRLGEEATGVGQTLSELAAEAEEGGDGAGSAQARIALGDLALTRGDHAQALESYEQALGSSDVTPASHQRLYIDMAGCYRELGRSEQAVSILREAIEWVDREAPGETGFRARYDAALALALRDLGERERARELLANASEAMQDGGDPEQAVRLLQALARLDIEAGRHKAALRKMRKAAALIEAMQEQKLGADYRALSAEARGFRADS